MSSFSRVNETPSQVASHRDEKVVTRDICFKVFIVVTIVLATVVAVMGILALLVHKGALPSGMTGISTLRVIGEVNSYGMLGGGIALFILGIVAWSCHLKKENQKATLNIPLA